MIATDRTVRHKDRDNRLHVAISNISKACVNPYMGSEIPGWVALDLDPKRVYHMLRCPKELAKAAATFNNLPLLSKHVPVDAESYAPELVVGSTGSEAAFDETGYLTNSLSVWAAPSIALIENDDQRELSSAYHYTADMTPGVFDGVAYDGVMRDIEGNHVALVDCGRAGSDVIVADGMPHMLKSKRAIMLHGAVAAYLAPKLAMDAALDLTAPLKGVTDKNLPGSVKKLAASIVTLAKPKLAQDEDIDVDAVCKIIDAVQGEVVEDDEIDLDTGVSPLAEDEDSPREDVIADLMDYLKGKLSDEDYEHAAGLIRHEATMDEKSDGDEDDKKPAMDANTVAKMIAAAEERGAKRAAKIDQAHNDVKPLVGRLVGMDSAGHIYRTALKQKGYAAADLHGVPDNALRAMCLREVNAIQKPTVAMDRKSTREAADSYAEMYGSK